MVKDIFSKNNKKVLLLIGIFVIGLAVFMFVGIKDVSAVECLSDFELCFADSECCSSECGFTGGVGKCYTPKSDGSACSHNSQCTSGICCGYTCRAPIFTFCAECDCSNECGGSMVCNSGKCIAGCSPSSMPLEYCEKHPDNLEGCWAPDEYTYGTELELCCSDGSGCIDKTPVTKVSVYSAASNGYDDECYQYYKTFICDNGGMLSIPYYYEMEYSNELSPSPGKVFSSFNWCSRCYKKKEVNKIGYCPATCIPSSACRTTTCIGSTCTGPCGNVYAGTKNCCTPSSACRTTTCIGSTCTGPCGNTYSGTMSCAPTSIGHIRIQGSSGMIKLNLISVADALLAGNGVVKVAKTAGDTNTAADLVLTTDPDASPVRIMTVSGIRAWRKLD